jgi:methionine salvage enolase-phosphatase E1
VFLSDVRAELDAAVAAGWHAVAVAREGAAPVGGPYPEVTTFAGLVLPD